MNPFCHIQARYFLIIFTLLLFIDSVIKYLLENTLHLSIQLSYFIDIFTLYIFPSFWLWYQYKRHGISFAVFINRREPFKLSQVLLITGMLCMFSYGFLVLYMYSFSWITPNFIMNLLHKPIVGSTGTSVSQIIIMVFVAPVIGELLFRGFLFQRFAAKWGTGKGMIVVALIFGCFHVDFLSAVMFSIVLSIVYIRTKSLLMPISIHMLNNIVVFTVSFMLSKEKMVSLADFLNYTTFFTGLILFIIGLNLLLVFLFANRRYMNKGMPGLYSDKVREL
ncbi:type II CAAX endopeptidase family protein [Bacillus sp. DX4.1]|uniref:CPBP family intramembrane glutamic endopeptidase n=1 Tax=Bacillus sp. DX4.1 TaxID=3055867 RepID=UPI0025A193BF|nr:type II CAAX endopeptidase family protein [Bacillus sp. DX4.1]MDM5187422.1 type II CAAX endopeptidase family protein [Bacillus sp. DX4.1]